jgi:hypothetical protein
VHLFGFNGKTDWAPAFQRIPRRENALKSVLQSSETKGRTMKSIFVDFEASSLARDGWPKEVGIAWVSREKITVESELIHPEST